MVFGLGVVMLVLPDALAGFKLFPCLPGDKLPALDYGWQTRATNDRAQLDAWDRGMDGLNWGVAAGPSGLFIIDVDPQGIPAWEAMQDRDPGLREAVKRSYTVRTPRGGFHHYFKGQGPTTASAIAPGIDTRGGYVDPATGKMKSTGYVVLPGSKTVAGPKTVDGEYTALGGVIEPMTESVLRIVPEKKKGAMLGLTRDPLKDQPRNVQWARDLLNNYVKEGRVSVEGHGGNNLAFQVAASILDKAISPALAYELMDELWNPHCSPAWDDWELERIVKNATEYGEETGGGSKGFEDNASAFAKFVGYDAGPDAPDAPSPEKRRDRVRWIDEYAAEVEDPTWLIPDLLPAQGVGMLYGASGSYKSFVALDWASCLAHGHPGQWGAPPVENDVLYFAGESPIGTAKQRRPAWKEWSGVKTPGRLAVFPRVPALGDGEGWSGVKADIEEMGIKPKLIIIDTLARLLSGFDESSTKDATTATNFMEELSRFYQCFVLFIHHTGKDETKGARGSSALFANVDTVISTSRLHSGTFVQVRKHKEADTDAEGQYLAVKPYGRSIVLEKSVAPSKEPPKASNKISWSEASEIVARLHKNGGRMSAYIMAEEIARQYNLERTDVQRQLKATPEIQWLRDGETWRIPSENDSVTPIQEFDL